MTVVLTALVGAAVCGGLFHENGQGATAGKKVEEDRPPTAPTAPTFNRDVAPIIFKHCSPCHRPEQSAPFILQSYGHLQSRARDIADVIGRRFMPPWPPEKGYGEFTDERRLTEVELETLLRWITHGTLEGRPEDLPPLPNWNPTWQLGTPDLVVQARPYTLGADGRDLYRNYVVPCPFPVPQTGLYGVSSSGRETRTWYIMRSFKLTRPAIHVSSLKGRIPRVSMEWRLPKLR